LAGHTLCVTCGAPLAGRYCGSCGELSPQEHDYSLRHFLREAGDTLFHLDGRVFKSFRVLVRQPGVVTRDYLRGRRKPYVTPLQLFLLANIVYFVVQPFTGFAAFTTRLSTHLGGPGTIVWEDLARRWVADRVSARQTTLATYEQNFDAMAHLQGKTLVILMVPAFALGAWAFNYRARRHYVEHLIFSFHFYAMLVLVMAASTLLFQLFLSAAATAGHRFSYDFIENTSSGALLLILGWHLFESLRRLFQRSAVLTSVQTIVLLAWSVIVLSAYRFILFLTTFAAT